MYVSLILRICYLFQKITSSIELRERNLSPHLRVRYFTRCLNSNGPLVQTNKCDGLRVGQTVEFEIEVELLSCPNSRDEWISHFSIYPVGVREELVVHVEMLCDCGCSKAEVKWISWAGLGNTDDHEPPSTTYKYSCKSATWFFENSDQSHLCGFVTSRIMPLSRQIAIVRGCSFQFGISGRIFRNLQTLRVWFQKWSTEWLNKL